MQRASDILYRFRGYILALLAIALFACPAAPFPQNYSRMVEIGPYLVTIFAYAIGIMLRIKSRQYIGEHTRGKTHEADKLVTDGPYAYCRHPLYIKRSGYPCHAYRLPKADAGPRTVLLSPEQVLDL